jgi:hypothetical protein
MSPNPQSQNHPIKTTNNFHSKNHILQFSFTFPACSLSASTRWGTATQILSLSLPGPCSPCYSCHGNNDAISYLHLPLSCSPLLLEPCHLEHSSEGWERIPSVGISAQEERCVGLFTWGDTQGKTSPLWCHGKCVDQHRPELRPGSQN